MAYIEPRADGSIMYVAECNIGGVRQRKRFKTMTKAKAQEKEWKKEATAKNKKTSETSTLGPLGASPAADKAEKLSTYLDAAVGSLWPVHRAAKSHQDSCRAFIRQFIDWVGDKATPKAVSKATLEDYLGHLASTRSASTCNSAHLAIRKFLDWLWERGYRDSQISHLKLFKIDNACEVTFNDDMTSKVVEWQREKFGDEYADFWYVSLRTAVRRNELLSTKPSQLTSAGLLLTKTKNKKSRVVPLLPKVREILEKRLPWTFTKRKLYIRMLAMRKSFGVHKTSDDFVLHTCRHSAITKMVENGVDLRTVQEISGHSSLEQLARYAKVKPGRLNAAVETLE